MYDFALLSRASEFQLTISASLSERGQNPEWASFKSEKGDFLSGLSKHGENEVEEDVWS